LEIQSFGDAIVLVKGHIRLDEGWVAELPGFLVAIRACGRNRKLPGRKNTAGSISTSACSLSVAGCVWIAEIIPVRQVIAANGKMRVCSGNVASRIECSVSVNGEGIARLVDASAAEAPSAGEVSD
jgi:hypothetical protein